MAMTKPRLAVGYHFYNDYDTLPIMLEEVRRTYDGPLAMATDYMVFNVTKDDMALTRGERRPQWAAKRSSGQRAGG